MLEKSSAGLETMASLKNAMDQIGESNVRMREMRRIIGEVGSKTEVINEIVFKTQLLAVNASIEAARAGHLGKGFAVVAGEVSNLAALSGKAATEIRNLVERSTVQVDEIADYIGESIDRGAAVTISAQNSFNYLSESISEITARVQQIDEATREQNVGVNQTSEAMTELNSVAMATSQTTVEAAEQSEKVLKVSKAINDIASEMSRLLSSSPLEFGIAPEKSPETKASTYGSKVNQVETKGESAKSDVTVKSGISGSLNRAKNQATGKLKARIISTRSTQKSNLKSKFEWHDKYDIGVPSMNNEPKEILRLMRELESAYQEAKPFATQMSLVQELGAYATKHFEDEEAFMKSIHYSDLENHKSIHKNLLSRYGGLSSEFQKNGVISEEFFGFLRSWLVAHIMGVDIKYGEVATQNKAAA